MRLLSSIAVRRTGPLMAFAGFVVGIVITRTTMSILGSSTVTSQYGVAELLTSGHRHLRADNNEVHHHNHDQQQPRDDDVISPGRKDDVTQLPVAAVGTTGVVVDLSAADRRQHAGLGGVSGCTYTWTAVAHRHVHGGVLVSSASTGSDCQSACINDTRCIGVDFNSARQCYLLQSSAAADRANGDVEEPPEEPKEEVEKGCVHYDLKRTCGAASDDNTIAQSLYNTVRILCWVMTTPDNHMSKAVHVQATWGRRCNVLLFVTEKDDVGALSVMRVDVETGREHLTAKTMSAFDHVYEHHRDEADWFLKADDDTYVIVENLRYFLSSESPQDPVFFGHHFKTIVKQGYFSGGAGYILSKEALTRLANRKKGECRQDFGAEDAEMGHCMERLGVRTGDSRDKLGRSRFHCFNPATHIHGGYPDWYREYDKYGAKKGVESISDYAISFHYVSVEELYNLEFYVYHLRPYGIVSGLQELNRKPRPQDTRPLSTSAESLEPKVMPVKL